MRMRGKKKRDSSKVGWCGPSLKNSSSDPILPWLVLYSLSYNTRGRCTHSSVVPFESLVQHVPQSLSQCVSFLRCVKSFKSFDMGRIKSLQNEQQQQSGLNGLFSFRYRKLVDQSKSEQSNNQKNNNSVNLVENLLRMKLSQDYIAYSCGQCGHHQRFDIKVLHSMMMKGFVVGVVQNILSLDAIFQL